ncbi:MAG: hypothetical protein DDT31_01608 [Syntrophomonadaceae bacterium]|nr:hypothetical protein [Bacillota bacterium]
MTAIEQIADILKTNYPSSGSLSIVLEGTETVLGGTRSTTIWRVASGWVAKLKNIHCDIPSNITVNWFLGGRRYEINKITFEKPLSIDQGKELRLEITNSGTITQRVDRFIIGWGDRIG